jgi:UDP-sugar transporter A1/2/3
MPFSFEVLLLTILVLQNTLTALLGHFTRQAVDKDNLYDIGQFILVSELIKLVTSVLLEFAASFQTQTLPRAITRKGFEKFKKRLYGHPHDLLRISVPAVFYWASNTLLYVAISNLSVPIFQVMVQTKLVVTAVVSVLLLGRHYSCRQWACLVVLSISVALVTLEEKKVTDTPTKSNAHIFFVDSNEPLIIGLIAVILSCLMSAFAGVYFEKILKTEIKDSPTIWMRNIQLALCSVVIVVLQKVGRGDFFPQNINASGQNPPFLHGFTSLVWCQVLLFAGGGLLVSAVIKYADNVLKGVAIGISVLLSTVASMFLFGTSITPLFSVCAIATIAAVYFFSNQLPRYHAKPYRYSYFFLIYIMVVLYHVSTMEGQDDLQGSLKPLPVETDLFPSDWNSTETALSVLRSIQERIQERSFHEATHILYDLRSHLGNRPAKYLEIGSYTGISSTFMLSHPFPTYATLVDPCVLSTEHFGGSLDQESTIRKNLASIVPNSLCNLTRPWDLHVGFSPVALPVGETFDIIFIDGDHSAKGVWADYDNTVDLLRPGGFMVFDDYLDWQYSGAVRGAVDNIAKSTDLIPIGSPQNIHGIHPQVNASFINEFIFQKPGKFSFSPLLTPGLERSTPVLCVTVATYRRPDGSTPPTLEHLWKMLQQQSYRSWKLYMTADHYDDEVEWNSLSFSNDSRVQMYNLPEPGERGKLNGTELWHNAGATAMNNAIDRALRDGFEWIVHLDDDDEWDTDHLQNILDGIRTGATFVTTWCQYTSNVVLPRLHGILTGITHTVLPKQCDTVHSSVAFNAAKILTRYKRIPGHPADAAMWARVVYDEGFYPAFVPVQSCYYLNDEHGARVEGIVRKSLLRDIDLPDGWHGEGSGHLYHTLATNEFPSTLSPHCQYVVGPEPTAMGQPSFRRLGFDEIPYHISVVKDFANLPVWAKNDTKLEAQN